MSSTATPYAVTISMSETYAFAERELNRHHTIMLNLKSMLMFETRSIHLGISRPRWELVYTSMPFLINLRGKKNVQ
jgi:hypothetical protein